VPRMGPSRECDSRVASGSTEEITVSWRSCVPCSGGDWISPVRWAARVRATCSAMSFARSVLEIVICCVRDEECDDSN
jgi:hypothetical protein